MRSAICICGLLLATVCLAQQEPASLDASERAAIIERVLGDLQRAYVFAESADKIVESIRAQAAAGAYDSVKQPDHLAARLTEDLRRVSHDRHLGLVYQPATEVRSTAFVPAQFVNYGFERIERLAGNIGYLDMRGFVPGPAAQRVCAAAFDFLAETDALIIDLRNNTGGSPAMVAHLASYFFAVRTHLTDIQEPRSGTTEEFWTLEEVAGRRYDANKKVLLLVGRGTFSAAEDFAYSLQAAGRASIVGEVTGGGAHPVSGRRVGSGITLLLPYARTVNPITGSNWEGVGVQPDVAAPAFEALHVAHGLLLAESAARTTNTRLAELLAADRVTNTAALAELRRVHAAERGLSLGRTQVAAKDLRANVAGTVAAEFLAAFNSGDLGVLQRFRARHSMNAALDAEDYAWYTDSGGFRLHSIAAVEPDGIRLLVQRKKDGAWNTLRFVVDAVAPHPILKLERRVARAPRP